MKYIFLLLIPFLSFSQQDVPSEYWITDNDFESAINTNEAFGDDETKPVVVEFWAKFNDVNAFQDWDKVEGVKYFRVDIAKSPEAKKKYRIRMAPTIIVFNKGIKEDSWKAGLDLECPVDLEELQEAIEEVKTADKF